MRFIFDTNSSYIQTEPSIDKQNICDKSYQKSLKQKYFNCSELNLFGAPVYRILFDHEKS